MSADLDEAASVFAGVRPRLFGIAYRMLGSVQEAEDVVQEVWLKWQAYDRGTVRDPAAFLATTTTRLSINATQTARVRRDTYVGPWLPEPVDTSADPALGAERGEALELAVLLLLEKLSPTQRAAYVRREAFDYPYEQIAEIVQLSQSNVRQLVSRSRKRLAGERREPVDAGEQRRLLDAFLAAAQQGDLAVLEKLLAADVVSYSDGGGIVRASRIPVFGRVWVSKAATIFASRFGTDSTLTWIAANGRTSVVVARDSRPYLALSISASVAGIDQIQWLRSPDKLAAVTEQVTALS